jgi:uncharacterized protein YabE (DUF348 family)
LEQGATAIRIESAEKMTHAPQTIVKQDPALALGEEVVESAGRNSFDVTVYRIKMQGNREVSREKISIDDFPGFDRVVRVGTKTPLGQVAK